MPKIVLYVIAVLVVIGLAEVSPEAVNAFLILLLIGIVLMRFGAFRPLVEQFATLGK